MQTSEIYLSKPRALQFWGSAMVVLPVFLQAPWVHLYPLSACFFTVVLLGLGVYLVEIIGERWARAGSLLVGVSGSWLGGCLFWGWLREYPIYHLPVEAFAFPLAYLALNTKWRIGAAFYLASLLGTAFTDLMMLLTGVIKVWPQIVEAPFRDASYLLNETAQKLLSPQPLFLLLLAAILILVISHLMKERAAISKNSAAAWMVGSAALITTLWVDGLFLVTSLIQPKLSGLI